MSVKKILSFVPNTITSFNVFSGSLSIVFAFEGNLAVSGALIILASVFDFFDGMSARLLNAYSPMGKELDSLADVISFGLAPSVIAFNIIKPQITNNQPITELSLHLMLMLFIPFIMAIFSTLRLAKFNIDNRQSDSFIGLPTPANAIIWASLPLIKYTQNQQNFIQFVEQPYTIIILSIILSFLLVCEMPMFSLKFKNLSFAQNKIRFIFIAICLILLIMFKLVAIPIIIATYILISAMLWIFKPKNK